VWCVKSVCLEHRRQRSQRLAASPRSTRSMRESPLGAQWAQKAFVQGTPQQRPWPLPVVLIFVLNF
jgi:hypothetical protein